MSTPRTYDDLETGTPTAVRAELRAPTEILTPGHEDLLMVALPRLTMAGKALVMASAQAPALAAGVECHFAVRGRHIPPSMTTERAEVHALLELGWTRGTWLYLGLFPRHIGIGPDSWTASLYVSGPAGTVRVTAASLLAMPEPTGGVDWGRCMAELLGQLKGAP